MKKEEEEKEFKLKEEEDIHKKREAKAAALKEWQDELLEDEEEKTSKRGEELLETITVEESIGIARKNKGNKTVKFNTEPVVHYVSDNDSTSSDDTIIISSDEKIRKNTSNTKKEEECKPLLADLVTRISDVDFTVDMNAYYSDYEDDFPLPLSQNNIDIDVGSSSSKVDDTETDKSDIVTYVDEKGVEFDER